MRQVRRGVLALLLWNLAAPVNAGIYQTVEPIQGPTVTKEGVEPVAFILFRDDVIQALPLVPAEKRPNNEIRERYLRQREELLRRQRTGRATDEDMVNLSAVLIRLGEPDKAVEVVTAHAGRGSRHFMLLANLATANYLADPGDPTRPGQSGRLTRAIDLVTDCLAVWPKEWPGLTAEQLAWYKRSEETFRSLLRSRRRELAQPAKELRGLDPLFGPADNPVRFEGESGAYEAGKLAPAEQAKLPPDATAVVQQLLIWLPADTRLCWLYGELLNAQGDLKTAREVLDYCVFARAYHHPELQEHRQQLNEAVSEAAAAARQITWLPDSWQLVTVISVAGIVMLALIFFQFRVTLGRRRRG
jgi:hypothetical protein